jgi:hypothetical protein
MSSAQAIAFASRKEPQYKMNETDGDGKATMPAISDSVAGYIASMADELAQLAKINGLDPLAFLLNMARLEADQIAKSADR